MQTNLFDITERQTNTEPPLVAIPCYAQVFLGDCLKLYKDIKPKSIDLILTDLPYGTTACKWDTIIPFDKLWEMVNYLLKPNGAFITTASQPFTSALVVNGIKYFKHQWIWEKDKPSNFGAAKYVPLKYFEDVLVFGKARTYNPQMWEAGFVSNKGGSKTKEGDAVFKSKLNSISRNSIDRYPKNIIKIPTPKHNSEGTFHPTQKPIALFEYLLKTYSNEGMTIFDPCMGSGTTGVACKNLNRNFIGIERDEQYLKIAKQRIISKIIE